MHVAGEQDDLAVGLEPAEQVLEGLDVEGPRLDGVGVGAEHPADAGVLAVELAVLLARLDHVEDPVGQRRDQLVEHGRSDHLQRRDHDEDLPTGRQGRQRDLVDHRRRGDVARWTVLARELPTGAVVESDHPVLGPVHREVPLQRRLGALRPSARQGHETSVREVPEQVGQRSERGRVRPRRPLGEQPLHVLQQLRLGAGPVRHRVVAPVLEQRVGDHRVAEHRPAEPATQHPPAPHRVEEEVVGDVVVVEDHVRRDVGQRPLHPRQVLAELRVDREAPAQPLLLLASLPAQVLVALLLRLLLRRHVEVARDPLREHHRRHHDGALGRVLVLGVHVLDVRRQHLVPVQRLVLEGFGGVGCPPRTDHVQAPEGGAPDAEVRRGELAEREQVAVTVGAGELGVDQRGPQPSSLGPVPPVGRDPRVGVGLPPGLRLVALHRCGVDGLGLVLQQQRLVDRESLQRVRQDRVSGGPDQVDAGLHDREHVQDRHVVGVDLVAAEEQLVGARVRVLVDVVAEDQVVDHGQGIGIAVQRPAARAVEDVELLQPGRRRREARQHVLLEPERQPREVVLDPVRQHPEREQVLQPVDRGARDLEVVGVERVGLEGLARRGGKLEGHLADEELRAHPQHRLVLALGEGWRPRVGLDQPLPGLQAYVAGLAQCHPHRDQARLHAAQDRAGQQQRKVHDPPLVPGWCPALGTADQPRTAVLRAARAQTGRNAGGARQAPLRPAADPSCLPTCRRGYGTRPEGTGARAVRAPQ